MTNPAISPAVERRLLLAGKKLFAQQGFENTTTSAIAREAATSESQLVKYFGSKEGLLLKIFEHGWAKMDFIHAAASVCDSPYEGLRVTLELLIKMLTEDRELRDLMLFEGRRIRGKNSEVLITSGYYRLYDEVTGGLTLLIKGTPLEQKIRPQAMASALIGMLESMLRDQAMAERKTGKADPTSDEIRAMFHLFTSCIRDVAKKQ